MAIDEADHADAAGFSESDASDDTPDGERPGPTSGSAVRVGAYTWADFMNEYGYGNEVSTLYPQGTGAESDQLGIGGGGSKSAPSGADWNRVSFDPTEFLGYHPDELEDVITDHAGSNAKHLWNYFLDYVDPATTPVTKDIYSWEHYKWEYYYEDDGSRPRAKDGSIEPFDGEAALGFDPEAIEEQLNAAGNQAMELDEIVDERTVDVNEDLDEDEFFSTPDGHTTVANRYDLEKAVPFEKKLHFKEEERYWVNKPYAFVVIFHSEKENEKKYYVIEPYCNEIESELQDFLSGKLRTAIKYSDKGVKNKADEDGRREVIEHETRRLLKRYDLFEQQSGKTKKGLVETFMELFDDDDDADEDDDIPEPSQGQLEGMSIRPEPVVLEEDPDTLNEYQVEKLLYLLKRNFIGYERIDGIKHDINVEDISCDGYNSPVFVYHSEYEQIISNVYHGKEDLDDFVVKLAQRSGKGISKRLPQVDATLPDGSRAQLTLGKEVSDHGTNYTIRQFKDVPFTPIDLINWNTFSLDQMAYLWLCIENHKSLIFAGGTASGKTTSLNAVSLFIPSNTKIVSIEDTREVELPQRNWIASMTRPSFADDSTGDIDEFDLLEAALRQRPDYIVMGEIRGEEGRTLFQVMSTGHTTYTTFHADSVDEVLKRFTTDPINVSKTMFTALDLVSIQTQTRVQGRKVRRNKSLTEINHYEAEHDEINVQDVYQWQAETDEYLKMGDSNTLDEIVFDRGWSHEKLQDELFKRQVILAYLIKNELNTYAEVAATIQAFINDPETILTLIANGQLENSLEDLREMESVLIDVDPEKEEQVPRPDPTNETYNLSTDLLERAEESLFDEYRGKVPSGLASALGDVNEAEAIEDTGPAEDGEFDFGGGLSAGEQAEWDVDDEDPEFSFGEESSQAAAEAPSWLSDDDGQAVSETAASTEPAASTETAPDRPELESPSETPDLPELESGSTATADSAVDDTPAGGTSQPQPGDRTQESVEDPSDSSSLTDSIAEDSSETGSPSLPSTSEQPDRQALPGSESTSSSGDIEADDDIDTLFTDMDDTLETLESGAPAPDTKRRQPSTSESTEIDTSDFDEMFPERDLESIFSDDSDDTGSTAQDDWGLGRRSPPNTSQGTGSDKSGRDEPQSSSGRHESDDGDDDTIFGNDSDSIFDDDGDDGDELSFGETDDDDAEEDGI